MKCNGLFNADIVLQYYFKIIVDELLNAHIILISYSKINYDRQDFIADIMKLIIIITVQILRFQRYWILSKHIRRKYT